MGASRPRRRWRRNLLLTFLATIGSVTGLELGYRGWLVLTGRPYRSAEILEELQRAVDVTGRFVPPENEERDEKGRRVALLHPFYGGEYYSDTGHLVQYVTSERRRNDYTILVLGGSVAAGWSGVGGQILSETLQAMPAFEGRNVKVLRGAHASYKQPQQLNRLTFLLSLGFVPDAVINLDGYNEVVYGLSNGTQGVHPLYPTWATWWGPLQLMQPPSKESLGIIGRLTLLRSEMDAFVDFAQRRRLLESSVLGRLTLVRVRSLARRRAALEAELQGLATDVDRGPASPASPATDGSEGSEGEAAEDRLVRQLRGPVFEGRPRDFLQMALGSWFECSLSIDALCDARGIEYLHFLQPTLLDKGSKPLSEEEAALDRVRWEHAMAGEHGYARMRELGAELRRRGVAFTDLSRVFESDERSLYYDPVHLEDPGLVTLAEAIIPVFLESLRDESDRSGGDPLGR